MAQINENMKTSAIISGEALSEEALENVSGGVYDSTKGDALHSDYNGLKEYYGFDRCIACNEEKTTTFYQTSDNKVVCKSCVDSGRAVIRYC